MGKGWPKTPVILKCELTLTALKKGMKWLNSVGQYFSTYFCPTWSRFTNFIPNHLPAKKFNTTHILYISLCIETDMCIYLCLIHRKNKIFFTHTSQQTIFPTPLRINIVKWVHFNWITNYLWAKTVSCTIPHRY